MTQIDEPLDVSVIRSGLRRCNINIGNDLRFFAEVDSTNRVLRDLPANGWRHGVVIITDYQNSGRGRGTRRWDAPPRSSILLSVGLSWPASVPLATATMVAGLSAGDAIDAFTGLATNLKWPNDVMIDYKKVAGILCEGIACNGDPRVIVGLGINVNFDVPSGDRVPATATSLMTEVAGMVHRERLIIALLGSIDGWYRMVTVNPESVYDKWRHRISTLGRAIVVDDGHEVWHGHASDVNGDGGLIVARGDGSLETVYAASISLRDLPGLNSIR